MNEGTANLNSETQHLKPAVVQEFLRGRLSRNENREIVRDLLRGIGSETVAAAATESGIVSALSGFDDGRDRFDPNPSRYSGAFSRLLGPAAERASRPTSGLEWQASMEPDQEVRSAG